MSEAAQRLIETNGIRLTSPSRAKGPLVLLCHGFPESWYSWRHQLGALAAARFPRRRARHARLRPERPAGGDRPIHDLPSGRRHGGPARRAAGAERAVIVGHDWGATVAWHAALLRPDRFRAVVGLSVPFRPRGTSRPTTRHAAARQMLNSINSISRTPGVAEAELERDPRATVRHMLYGGSGDAPRAAGSAARHRHVPRGGGFSPHARPEALPAWLSEADIDFYAGEFARTGFRGGLNWYRNIDRNWELLAPFAGAQVTVPALYVAGDRDMVRRLPRHGPADRQSGIRPRSAQAR